VARLEEPLALRDVFAGVADVLTGRDRVERLNLVADSIDLLYHHDRVGPVGERASRVNPRGFAGDDRLGFGLRGPQHGRGAVGRAERVLGTDRVPVHRRPVVARNGRGRVDRFGDDSAVGVGQRDRLGPAVCVGRIEKRRQRLVDPRPSFEAGFASVVTHTHSFHVRVAKTPLSDGSDGSIRLRSRCGQITHESARPARCIACRAATRTVETDSVSTHFAPPALRVAPLRA